MRLVPDDERRSRELGASYERSRSDDQDERRARELGFRWSDTSYDLLVLLPTSS
jgi:hypothetical protein